jgi:hypothetical protein
MVGTGSHDPQKGQGKPCGSCVCGMQLENWELAGQGEILQTTTIPLNDVRKELPLWKEAMLKEYNNLV